MMWRQSVGLGSRPTRAARRWAALALAGLLGNARAADASWPPERKSDGVYGRLDGDTDLSLKLGAEYSHSQWAGSVGGSLHHFSVLGLTLDYSESFQGQPRYARSFSIGPELRPLFLPRWLLNLERGPAWLDLTIDSASLGFGVYYAKAAGAGADCRAVWFSAGLGVPLLGHATGPWLELRALRRVANREPLTESTSHDALFMYLSWHHLVQLHPAPDR